MSHPAQLFMHGLPTMQKEFICINLHLPDIDFRRQCAHCEHQAQNCTNQVWRWLTQLNGLQVVLLSMLLLLEIEVVDNLLRKSNFKAGL